MAVILLYLINFPLLMAMEVLSPLGFVSTFPGQISSLPVSFLPCHIALHSSLGREIREFLILQVIPHQFVRIQFRRISRYASRYESIIMDTEIFVHFIAPVDHYVALEQVQKPFNL